MKIAVNWLNGAGLPENLYDMECKTVTALFYLQRIWHGQDEEDGDVSAEEAEPAWPN